MSTSVERVHRFRVEGMCCVEETSLLRQEVGPALTDPENLRFDLLRGLMIVEEELDETQQSNLLSIVSKTGMKGEVFTDETEEAHQVKESAGNRPLLLSTIVAAVATATGVALLLLLGAESTRTEGLVTGLFLVASAIGLFTVLPRAWIAVRYLRPDMNLLMSVAVVGAIVIEEPLEAAVISTLFAFSLLLESWSIGRARRAVERLMERAPARAVRISSDGSEEVVDPSEVSIGDRLLVRPGDTFPVDGRIAEGNGDVNAAAVTGESRPVAVSFGSPVYAGTTNIDARLTFVAVRQASESTWARIVRLVEEAGTRRSRSEQWVEKFARIYTPAIFIGAILVAFVPPLLGFEALSDSVYRGLVLLVIGCPCALVIATPVAVVAGLARAAREGVLIKGGEYLEVPARIETIAFDKTGTLTTGTPEVVAVEVLHGEGSGGGSVENLLSLTASLSAGSGHPLSRAIVTEASRRGLSQEPSADLRQVPGRGLRGRRSGEEISCGSVQFLKEEGVDVAELQRVIAPYLATGSSIVAVALGGDALGAIILRDTIRAESNRAISELKELGVRTVMITGDSHEAGRYVADSIGIQDIVAGVLPDGKVEVVEELLEDGTATAMVGDGINDAPAMARADIGIAMGTQGSDIALETADVALMGDDLLRLPWLVRHGRRSLSIIRGNIFLALGIKVVILVATLAGLGSLWGAIVADIGSTLLVTANALRLLRGE